MARQGYDLQLTRYDEKGWRATFYTSGMEHSATSATDTGWERTPWHAVQRARGMPSGGQGSMAEQRPQKRRKVSLRRPMTALATGQVLVMVSTGCRSRTIVLSYTPPAATTMSGPRLVILP